MRALITGATGFVGRRLLTKLDQPAVVLSRNAAKAERTLAKFEVTAFDWDAENQPAPAEAFEGVDVIFHLAGEPVSEGRWTKAKKERLRESRVAGTRNLVQTITQLANKPRVLISASAVGYYGDRGDEILTEDASPREDFLGEICISWERESHAARLAGIRVVNPRIGIVLGEHGGAIGKMLTPFWLGLGSPLGSGKQYMPWIHIDDLVHQMLFAAERESISGPLNGTAPNPVTNLEFTKTLGKVLNRPTFLPAPPTFVLKAAIGEFANVLLQSQRAVPQRSLDAGFHFHYPDLEPALRQILAK
ncbi:Epimerase family protein [Anatilimnocola aggregata]|uniref:Epimerase family protein n=1 Tax=Anatilimnocola aggregata TaxID=2528021 RepID=A0A517Y6B4_9BACT|nr:TIGR01777 family oxidoreductase [Anatilimnocola aggregata]QDU25779.1 Epimerase family protein [Anatilimnocola aggregata]